MSVPFCVVVSVLLCVYCVCIFVRLLLYKFNDSHQLQVEPLLTNLSTLYTT